MTSYLQKLENNEAILLMYLAGELPEADRKEVDQMLASDARLRSELEILRQTQQLAFDALESLDELARKGPATPEAQNRIVRQINQWVQKRREPAAQNSKRQLPWRRIAFAAAACLMVGYYIWAVYDRLDQDPRNRQNDVAQSDDGQMSSDNPDQTLPDEEPHTAPLRELSSAEKLALLSNSLEESNADDSSQHVAEVAAVIPIDTENSADAGHGADSNTTGAP
jgi:ElaB/YqjD/DUF883 family membrane-anchored ribosome-binding protein